MAGCSVDTIMQVDTCDVCFDGLVPCHLNICGSSCTAKVCEECIKLHFQHILTSSLPGFGVKMTCPMHLKKVVSNWDSRFGMDESFVREVKQRASMSLSMQCSKCHKLTTLLASHTKVQHLTCLDEQIQTNLEGYLQGDMNAAEFFQLICNHSGEGGIDRLVDVDPEPDSAVSFIQAILQSINDPERRASLQFCYLKLNPKIITPCCKALHCFSCAVAGSHDGLSCEEYQMKNGLKSNDDILPCPSCGLQLVKGDGCSSVICPCGNKFNWAKAKNDLTLHLSDFYQKKYGDKAAYVCAQELYQAQKLDLDSSPRLSSALAPALSLKESSAETTNGACSAYAVAWANHHPEELRKGRAELWKHLNPMYPAESSLFTQMNTGPSHYLHCLARDYAKFFPEQIDRVKTERRLARVRTWITLYEHNPVLCGKAAYKVLVNKSTLLHRKLNLVCDAWMHHETNTEVTMQQGDEIKRNNADAWDFLHGGYVVGDTCIDRPGIAAIEIINSYQEHPDRSPLGDTHKILLEDWIQVHEHGRMKLARARRWEYRNTCTSALDQSWVEETNSPDEQQTLLSFQSTPSSFLRSMHAAIKLADEHTPQKSGDLSLKYIRMRSVKAVVERDCNAFLQVYAHAVAEQRLLKRLEEAKEYELLFQTKELAASNAFMMLSEFDLLKIFKSSNNRELVYRGGGQTSKNDGEGKELTPPWYSSWLPLFNKLALSIKDPEQKRTAMKALIWAQDNLEVMSEAWSLISVKLEQQEAARVTSCRPSNKSASKATASNTTAGSKLSQFIKSF